MLRNHLVRFKESVKQYKHTHINNLIVNKIGLCEHMSQLLIRREEGKKKRKEKKKKKKKKSNHT